MLDNGSLILEGRFRVLSPLGAGGMGEVYLAEQVSLGRKVALKVLRADLVLQPGMSERFQREAKLLSSVDHPSVVRVIDFGQSPEATCLVMELVEGETLQSALRDGPLPVERALPLLLQLAEGLAAIHDRGIVHRDLKPENVVLTRGTRGEQARLLDFGIARLAEPEEGAGVTQAGFIIGTPEYLSPEQATGAALDARSDLYSFGVLAFRLLTGGLPFEGPGPRQFLAQHAGTAPRRPEEVAPHLAVYPELCALLLRCLEKDPAQRPGSAPALAAELARLCSSPKGEPRATPLPAELAPTTVRRALPAPPPARWRLSRRTMAGAAALLLAVALAFLLLGESEEGRIGKLISENRAQAALLELERLSRGGKERAPLKLLKAAALHRLERHGEEHALCRAVSAGELSEADPLLSAALAEDFGLHEEGGVKKLLDLLPRKELLALAREAHAPRSWGALRYLDQAGERRVELVEGYIAALEAEECQVRSLAARRLGELGDAEATEPLRRLSEAPRKSLLGLLEADCGHAAARAALRGLEKKR